MPYDYAWEKLHTAMHSLAGEGPLRERRMNAILSFFTLRQGKGGPQVPPEIRNKFDEFWRQLKVETPEGKQKTREEVIEAMSDQQVRECVATIISMYDGVARHQEPWPD